MIKRTDTSSDWLCFHREFVTGNHYMVLNSTAQMVSESDVAQNTRPTSSVFSVGTDSKDNADGGTYVAYLFAGGESTAATARSVNFDGSSDYLHSASSSDLTMGTGDFTVEGWIKFKTVPSSHAGFYQISSTATGLQSSNYGQTIAIGYSGSNWRIYGANGSAHSAVDSTITAGTWYHLAHVRSSGVSKLYVNGVEVKSITDTYDYDGTYLAIGSYYQAAFSSDAYISNFRVVKGTAVYTSSFKPPTEPLTNITNTKVLCCNNTSITGKTVGPTLTDYGNVAANTDSPFDDPAGFAFGENEDQNVIKCGSYVGNGSTTGPEINLGWEPQWVMIKKANGAADWLIMDSMRGIVTGGNDPYLQANSSDAEDDDFNNIKLTATGFQLEGNHTRINNNGDTYIYTCLRRPDGYVGKPAEAGTGVFAMDTGSGSSTIPNFDSGFVVDMSINRQPATSQDWYLSARLIQKTYLKPNSDEAGATGNSYVFDSNVGWDAETNRDSDYQGWMFKRHAGFDVVTYDGNGSTKTVNHSLGRVPEMIWIKDRSTSQNWLAYHKGLNGGTTPWNYHILLNTTGAEGAYSFINQPTTIDFAVTSGWQGNGGKYIAMLFASVDGISKVGSYVGQGSDLTVEFGFSPRFLMVKRIDSTGDWNVFDTTRGLVSGADKELRLNNTSAQSDHEVGDITSTGFTFACGGSHDTCSAGGTWIYYAHA